MSNHQHKASCCGAQQEERACTCGHEHGKESGACSCTHDQQVHGCSCAHEHDHRVHSCSCAHEHDRHEQGCSCSCGHDHGDDAAAKRELPRLLAALLLFVLGLILPVSQGMKTIFLLICYAVAGYDVLLSALRSLGKRRMLDENFLMAVASLAAIGIGEITEGCAVMLFYQVGERFQATAVGRSRRQIKALPLEVGA